MALAAIPDGIPTEAIDRYPAPGLPWNIFQSTGDTRRQTTRHLRDPRILNRWPQNQKHSAQQDREPGMDADRIGGGLTEFLGTIL